MSKTPKSKKMPSLSKLRMIKADDLYPVFSVYCWWERVRHWYFQVAHFHKDDALADQQYFEYITGTPSQVVVDFLECKIKD